MHQLKKWNGKTGRVTSFGVCTVDYESIVHYLGAEHYLEENPMNTHSGRELFWLFEAPVNKLLAFRYHEISKEMYVGTNDSVSSAKEAVYEVFPIKLDFSEGVLWD